MQTVFCTDYPDFPEHIDSSLLTTFKECEQRCFRQYFQHIHPSERSVHLVAGGAYAKGMETVRREIWEKGTPFAEALHAGYIECIKQYGDFEPPAKSPKTLENLLLAIGEYFRNYGTDTDPMQPFITPDGKAAVEFTFAIPLPGTKHPVTGDPILYCGRFDMLCLYMKSLYVEDDKTTGQLGPSWLKQWDLRSQFIGYCWAARQYGYPIAGAVVRGLSILSKDFGHAQAITYCPPHIIDRWLDMTVREVNRLVKCWENKEWNFNFDAACTAYGGCPYKILCDKKDPERWVATNFKVAVWNPME